MIEDVNDHASVVATDVFDEATRIAAVLALKTFALQNQGSFKTCDLGKPSRAGSAPNFYKQFPQHKLLIQTMKLPQLCAAYPADLRYERASAPGGQHMVF